MPLTQSIGLETLSKYFHLPINDVAKELGVCATVLKKICRRNGIPRWPHRKIKSLDKMIASLDASVAKNPEDEERIRHEIQTLHNRRSFLVKNPNVLASKGKKGNAQAKRGKENNNSAVSPHRIKSTVGDIAPITQSSRTRFPPADKILVPTEKATSSIFTIISPSSTCHWSTPDHESNSVPEKIVNIKHQHYAAILEQFAGPSSPQDSVPPSLSPPVSQLDDTHAVPHIEMDDIPVHLPKLHIIQHNNKTPKLGTLEPEMFPNSSPLASCGSPKHNTDNYTTSTSPHRWAFPEWFEDEHNQILKNYLKQEESLQIQPSAIVHELPVPTVY